MMRILTFLLVWAPLVGLAQTTIDPTDVQIARDSYGVPHVFGKTDADVAYGLAWAHAEDDFVTIQQTLLAGKAMLGRHMGTSGAPIDFLVQWLRVRDRVESHYRKDISPEYQAIIAAYAQGVNAYAAAHPKEVLVKRAFPVSEEDIMVAYQLSIALFSNLEGTLNRLQRNAQWTLPMSGTGSNGFAFNSTKTTDGQTYLAINSHQPLTGPQAWYEVHLQSEEGWNALGGTFPGGNSVFHGVNEHLGWAHTVNHPDKMDVFQLVMHPQKKDLYRFDGEWRELEVRKVPLRVKLGPLVLPLRKKAKWSVYGPVWEADNGTFALRYPAMFNLRTPETWYRMNKARNFTEWHGILAEGGITHFNIVYADRYDTIYHVSNARMPYRTPGYDWARTVPGDTSATLWSEEIQPLDRLPQTLQPKSGYVYNTNNSPFQNTAPEENPSLEGYDSTMGFGMRDNNRSARFMELVEGYDRVSYNDFLDIKYDLTLPDSLHYEPNINFYFTVDPAEYPEHQKALEVLQGWNGEGTVDNTGAALFIEIWQYYRSLPESERSPAEQHMEGALTEASKNLMEHFGRLDVPLGDYQRLVRGDKSLPLPGLPDVLAAMYSNRLENGQVAGVAGESYILLVRFTPEGPVLESVNVYGASNNPESPHYADQMELFVEQKTKPMTLDKEQVLANAVRVYHPGE